MPFLTRDFAVFLGIVTFLIGGIFVTVTEDYFGNRQVASVVKFAEDEVEYKVEESAPVEDSRPARLAELRDKVKEYMKSVVVVEKEPDIVEVPPAPEEATDDMLVDVCATYRAYSGSWNAKGLKFEVVEGARLVYREVDSSLVPASTASTSIEAVPTREVLVQLPLRSFPNKNATCLSSDVIGIATDGSLIRNNELGLYKVFGSETLIGYTLDGFTLYGTGEGNLDKCGGKVVAGEYRYYIEPEREGIIGCYSGAPITL